MSEQRTAARSRTSGFMAELDKWTDAKVINPLHEAVMDGDDETCQAVCDQIKDAIRQKVLESYRNGQAAGPRVERKEGYAQARNR